MRRLEPCDRVSLILRDARKGALLKDEVSTLRLNGRPYSRSTIVTLAMPPPSHMVCRP